MKLHEIIKEGILDWAGRKSRTKTTKGKPPASEAPQWANFLAKNASGGWLWLEREGPVASKHSDKLYPESGRVEFSGYQSNPEGWPESLHPIGGEEPEIVQ